MSDKGMPWAKYSTEVWLGGQLRSYGSKESAWRDLNPAAAARWDAANRQPAYSNVPGSGPGGGVGGSATGGSISAGNVTGGGNIQQIADPFASQRAQYQTQLSSLMANPSSFTSSPLAQAMNQNGIEAINRTAAAKHQLKSGNRLADLMKYGQGNAASQYFNQAQLLGGLSGAAPGSPAAAASNTVSLANLASGQNMYQAEQDKQKKAIEDANWQNAYNNLYKNMSVF